MSEKIAHYDAQYGGFSGEIYAVIRRETFGEDMGQNSWLTTDEFRQFLNWLELSRISRVLDVGCGSGGPALFIARTIGCNITGVDIHEKGIEVANKQSQATGLVPLAQFRLVDGSKSLPFKENAFDTIVCIDAINHLPNRLDVLREWQRILRPGGRLLFTDPITVTGLLSSEEIAVRSSAGFYLFAAPDEDERLMNKAGFELLRREDVTENMELVAKRWHEARAKHAEFLIQAVGKETFEGQQKFFAVTHELARERRLSRFVFLARKLAN